MRRIQSNIDTQSLTFRTNETFNRNLLADLRESNRKARFDRPERDITRLRRQKKQLVRERIDLLLDHGTPFMELSTLAANMAYDGTVPGAGIVSGVGIVNGREVLIMANDSSIKGGAWYPLTTKKMVRTTDIAIENHLPIEKIMLYPFLLALGFWMAGILFYSGLSGQEVGQFISEYIARYQAVSGQLFTGLEGTYPDMAVDRRIFERNVTLVLMISPGLFVCSYLMMICMNLIIIKRILLKQGIVVSSIDNLSLWKAPEFLVYGLIAVSILSFFASGFLKIVSVNLIVILLLIYCFQGIAVVSFFFQKKQVPPMFRFILYLLVAIMPQILLLVVGCGLFDNWFNFRKLNTTTAS